MSEPHDVRGHFPFHEYDHPTDHGHDKHGRIMSEPQTETHDHPDEVCEPCWKDGFNESRDATLDEVLRAVDGLRRPGRSDVNHRAVIEAVKALR